MTQSTVTIPLKEFLDLKGENERLQKLISEHIEKGSEIIVQSSFYFGATRYYALNPTETTRKLSESQIDQHDYRVAVKIILNKKLPTFIHPGASTVRDLFKHDERIKDL